MGRLRSRLYKTDRARDFEHEQVQTTCNCNPYMYVYVYETDIKM